MIESLLWIQVGQIAKEEKDDNLNSLHLARTAHFLLFLERNSFVSSYKPLARTAFSFPFGMKFLCDPLGTYRLFPLLFGTKILRFPLWTLSKKGLTFPKGTRDYKRSHHQTKAALSTVLRSPAVTTTPWSPPSLTCHLNCHSSVDTIILLGQILQPVLLLQTLPTDSSPTIDHYAVSILVV